MQEIDRVASAWRLAVVGLVMSVVFYRVSYTTADPDLWGHVLFGLDVLRDGFLHRTDSYSFLSDQPWINHEWLTEILFGVFFNLAGAYGLIALKVTLSMAMFGLLYRHLLRTGFDTFRGGMVLLLVLYPTLLGLVTLRPHIFTYIGFLLILLILSAVEKGRRGWIWAAAPVLLAWTNLHGGFLAGFGILAIWLAAQTVERVIDPSRRGTAHWRRWGVMAAAVGVAGLATLVNPYGHELLLFLGRTATVERPEIGEWRPIVIMTRAGASYLILVTAALFAFIKSRRPKRFPLVVVFIVTALLPLMALRHLPLFAFSFGVLAAEHLADALSRIWPVTRAGRREDPFRVPFIGACLVASLALIFSAAPRLKCIPVDLFPIAARSVTLLKDSGVSGNLAIFFNWGEYAIWHLAPQVKVSIDGRRETVYSEQIRTEHLDFIFGRGSWDAVLEKYPVDLALISTDKPFYNLMLLKPGWELIYKDSLSAIFAPVESPLADQIKNTPVPDTPVDGKGLCFP